MTTFVCVSPPSQIKSLNSPDTKNITHRPSLSHGTTTTTTSSSATTELAVDEGDELGDESETMVNGMAPRKGHAKSSSSISSLGSSVDGEVRVIVVVVVVVAEALYYCNDG